MGFRSAGVCYDTGEEAFQHFLSQYPKQQGNIIYSAEYGNEIGLGQYEVALTDSLGNQNTSTVKFSGCNSSIIPLSDMPQANIIFIVALVVLWALGLSAGLKR